MKKHALKNLKDHPSLDYLLARGRSFEAIMVKWRRRGINILNPYSYELDYKRNTEYKYKQNYEQSYRLRY